MEEVLLHDRWSMRRWWVRTGALLKKARRTRHLHLCETLSLGERRLVAVVRCDGERLLLGATGNSIALLTRLQPETKVGKESEE